MAIEEPGRKQIARASGIDHLGHRCGGDMRVFAPADRMRALVAAGDHQRRDLVCQRGNAVVKILAPGQRGQFVFIGKQDVEFARRDQRAEIIAMAGNHKGIGQREGHLAPGGARRRDCAAHRAAGLFGVPQIAFEIEHFGIGDHAFVQRLGRQELRCAQKRVHRALPVGRHEDQAARGGRLTAAHRGGKGNPGGADIVGKHFAQLIIGDLADKGARRSQRGHPGQCVGRRSARNFARRTHRGIKIMRARFIDQRHPALGQIEPGNIVVMRRGHDIDNRIADRDDIVTGGGLGHYWRLRKARMPVA